MIYAHGLHADGRPRLTALGRLCRMGEGTGGSPLQKLCQKGTGLNNTGSKSWRFSLPALAREIRDPVHHLVEDGGLTFWQHLC